MFAQSINNLQPFTGATILRLLFLLFAFMLFAPCVGQVQGVELTVDQFRKLIGEAYISFEDYKTLNLWNGRRHRPILDTPFKRRFRTVITNASKGAPDFDGKYVIASWHCGTECQHFVIINLETGVVADGLTTNFEQVYRADSSLLIVNDPTRMLQDARPEDRDQPLPPWYYTAYYRWDRTKLVLIKSTKAEKP